MVRFVPTLTVQAPIACTDRLEAERMTGKTTTPLSSAARARRRADSLLLPKDGASHVVREPVRVNPRLAVYVRLSAETEASVSIARQRETLERYVRQLGGVYDAAADYYEDDDKSAKGTVYRDGAELLLRAIVEDRYDGIVVWEFARFMRNKREAHIAFGLMEQHGVELYSHAETSLSLHGPGRMLLEFHLEQAAKEIEKTSSRVTAAHQFMAQFGRAPAHAPFGTRKVEVPFPGGIRVKPIYRLEPDDEPREDLGGKSPAQLVREAAAAYIAGVSARSVVRGWNAAGYPSAGAAGWSSSTLTQLLGNPLLAGYSRYRGELVCDDAGTPQLFHVPVLDKATWEDLSAVLAQRPASPRGTNDSPLRGLLRCGKCGGAMTRSGKDRHNSYRCWRDNMQAIGCHNTIVAGKTEAVVIEAALAVLSDPARLAELHAALDERAQSEHDALEQQAAAQRTALERLDFERVTGQYDDVDGARRYERIKSQLLAQLNETLTAQRRARKPRPLALPGAGQGMTPAEAFDAATPAERLTVLCQLIEHVVVQPAKNPNGARVYDPTRLSIVWHQGEL